MHGTEFLVTQFEALSYLGVFFTSLISNIFIPVPEEITLLLFGYISREGIFNITYLIPIVILGLLISDVCMYLLALKGNRFVTFFYKKFFERIVTTRGDAWIKTRISSIVFVSRFMIQFRFLGPFLAGYTKTSIKTFLLYDFLALCIYVPTYILLGRFFNKKVSLIIENVNTVRNVIVLFFVAILVFSLTKILYVSLFSHSQNKINQ